MAKPEPAGPSSAHTLDPEETAELLRGEPDRSDTGADSLVPTTPITISAMKPICTVPIFSPNRTIPPMMTPTAPRPVQIA